MSLDEPTAPRFDSVAVGAERSSEEKAQDAATQPMADLPLFATAETPPAPDEHLEKQASTATRPLDATRSSSEPGSEGGRTVTAPLRDRLLAGGVDLIALALTLGVLVGISAVMGVTVRSSDLLLFLPTWLAFGFFYQVMPLLFWGRTPGMQVAGIESRDADGQPLSLQQAALRWLAALVTWLLLGLPGLLALTGRSLTDRMSGSRTFASS